MSRCARCCGVAALIAVSAAVAFAQPQRSEPLSLFPVRPAWNLPLNSLLTATPALVGSRGYFPLEDDRIAAYDLARGALLWIAHARAGSTPAVGDGHVFVAEPESITALREDTGAVAWRLPFRTELSVPLVWDLGWLVGADSAGTVFALRATDGGLIWKRDLGSAAHASPALAADRVYVPVSDGRIVALQVETGEIRWERRLGGAPNEILALDDRLYVGSDDNYLYCVRTTNGEILWRWSTGADVVGLPIVDEHRVYFVSLDNVLRGLDRKTGAQRWKTGLPLRPTRGLVRAGDTLIVSGLASTSPAYAMRDGSPAGDLVAEGELAAAPHVLPEAPLPTVALVTRDIISGAVVRALTRSVDPAVRAISPLPDIVLPVSGLPAPRVPTTTTTTPEKPTAPQKPPQKP